MLGPLLYTKYLTNFQMNPKRCIQFSFFLKKDEELKVLDLSKKKQRHRVKLLRNYHDDLILIYQLALG